MNCRNFFAKILHFFIKILYFFAKFLHLFAKFSLLLPKFSHFFAKFSQFFAKFTHFIFATSIFLLRTNLWGFVNKYCRILNDEFQRMGLERRLIVELLATDVRDKMIRSDFPYTQRTL